MGQGVRYARTLNHQAEGRVGDGDLKNQAQCGGNQPPFMALSSPL